MHNNYKHKFVSVIAPQPGCGDQPNDCAGLNCHDLGRVECGKRNCTLDSNNMVMFKGSCISALECRGIGNRIKSLIVYMHIFCVNFCFEVELYILHRITTITFSVCVTLPATSDALNY